MSTLLLSADPQSLNRLLKKIAHCPAGDFNRDELEYARLVLKSPTIKEYVETGCRKTLLGKVVAFFEKPIRQYLASLAEVNVAEAERQYRARASARKTQSRGDKKIYDLQCRHHDRRAKQAFRTAQTGNTIAREIHAKSIQQVRRKNRQYRAV